MKIFSISGLEDAKRLAECFENGVESAYKNNSSKISKTMLPEANRTLPGVTGMTANELGGHVLVNRGGNCSKKFISIVQEEPKLVDEMLSLKNNRGQNLFNECDIKKILEFCKDEWVPVKNYKEKITAILNNPEEVKIISASKDKAYAMIRALEEPLADTKNINPDIWK